MFEPFRCWAMVKAVGTERANQIPCGKDAKFYSIKKKFGIGVCVKSWMCVDHHKKAVAQGYEVTPTPPQKT